MDLRRALVARAPGHRRDDGVRGRRLHREQPGRRQGRRPAAARPRGDGPAVVRPLRSPHPRAPPRGAARTSWSAVTGAGIRVVAADGSTAYAAEGAGVRPRRDRGGAGRDDRPGRGALDGTLGATLDATFSTPVPMSAFLVGYARGAKTAGGRAVPRLPRRPGPHPSGPRGLPGARAAPVRRRPGARGRRPAGGGAGAVGGVRRGAVQQRRGRHHQRSQRGLRRPQAQVRRPAQDRCRGCWTASSRGWRTWSSPATTSSSRPAARWSWVP